MIYGDKSKSYVTLNCLELLFDLLWVAYYYCYYSYF